MGLNDLTEITLERALAGSALRQQALANNIANADTPGYQRLDVNFQSALDQALQDSPTQQSLASVDIAAAPDGQGVVGPNGSTVDIDKEMADMSENSLEYQALASVTKARLHMIQIAIGGQS